MKKWLLAVVSVNASGVAFASIFLKLKFCQSSLLNATVPMPVVQELSKQIVA